MKTYSLYGNCPKCKKSWNAGSIPKKDREHYSPPYKYSELIGVEITEEYDGIDHWKCPFCEAKFKKEEISN